MVNSMEKKMVTLIIPATLAIMKLIAYQLSTSGILNKLLSAGYYEIALDLLFV